LKTYKPGDVILGEYKVTRILGQRGGMGQVLAAGTAGTSPGLPGPPSTPPFFWQRSSTEKRSTRGLGLVR
jgi:hypothetical protein